MLLVLDPSAKMGHFKKYWSTELQADVIKTAENIVCYHPDPLPSILNHKQYKERYLEMYGTAPAPLPPKKKDVSKVAKLLRQLSDSDSEDDGADNATPVAPADPKKPWLPGFRLHLDTQDHLNGMSLAHWWGVRGLC
jgi:hypothetical protein